MIDFTRYSLTSSFVLSLILIFSICFCSIGKAVERAESNYELSLSFDPNRKLLIGTSKITIEAGRELTLFLQGIEITGTLLRDAKGIEHQVQPMGDRLTLQAVSSVQTLYLSYSKTISDDFDNQLTPEGISLINSWYPLPDQVMLFQLTATLPPNFSAITEADSFPLKQRGNTVSAFYSKPSTTIHFVAGPYVVKKLQVRQGLFVYSMFFKEDKDLASSYLQAAVDYLNRYEQEIGPYPFNHYVIVANRKPTGYGMPTFSLLGQQVLRLPFIKDTSLGHEIVHSWFGHSVEVDYSQGNWCEGLTSFLADHAFMEERGEGVRDRLESITKYHSYVHKETTLSLAAFTSADHNQPMAEAKRAVGYLRGALLFHELRAKIGHQPFLQGLHRFYNDNRGKQANWDDLRTSFESVSKVKLNLFFIERLNRSELPQLAVEDIGLSYRKDQPVLNFNLIQKSEKPFTLTVPIQIKMFKNNFTTPVEVTGQKTHISIPLDQKPLEFTIDPEYSFFRQLPESVLPAVWSRFMGSTKPLIILGLESERERYLPLINALGKWGIPLIKANEVTDQKISEHDLLFLGINQPSVNALFGQPGHPENGFTLDVRRNPLNRNHVAVLVSSSGRDQTMTIVSRISHYGKYSYLEFIDGRNTSKRIEPVNSDLHFVLESLPQGGAVSSTGSFEQIIDQLNQNRVVYVGEDHTSLADHLLQLRIIEALHDKNPNLAIGMEMFPTSSQPALDRYTLRGEEMDVRTFLKDSDYYNVWRYDYRFFQDILNFARRNHLPVIALNLEREIVSEVFRSGGTDTLKKEIRESLPKDRDLDMKGYGERLSFIHTLHMQGSHGNGTESGFIQAQGIWDETMAENITHFLITNPKHRMVVLAGSQHTRKDFGIPPRVARRLVVPQTSVLNIYNDNPPANLGEVADYFFLVESAELTEAPKMGIVLSEETVDGKILLKISQVSPHGKAAASGLLEGDILLQVNGYVVSTMADLRIAMFNTHAGDTVDVTVIREKDTKKRQILFQVELTLPPPSHSPL